VPYAVFRDFDRTDVPGLAKRWVRSDDEDDDNADITTSTSAPELIPRFSGIVGGEENTMFDMVRVR
jgi:hypothetical protein